MLSSSGYNNDIASGNFLVFACDSGETFAGSEDQDLIDCVDFIA
jgi:hypothetical protein